MAGQLAAGFAAHDAIRLPWSVDANELFPVIPEALREQLREAGLVFYDWPQEANMTRFVTHFGTDPAEIARALEAIAASQ
jgi:threonine aldolase